MQQYRHEYKYPLTNGQMVLENARISVLAQKDVHVGEKGFYNIRSLYFDDCENSCYLNNENCVDDREKYRIRIYDHSTDWIVLERKEKKRGKTGKSSCPITLS